MDPNNAPQNQPESPAPAPAPVQPVAPAAVPATSNGSGFAIAALVLGIIAFLFGWLGFLNLLTAILAVVFGIIALKKHQSKGMALTGLILGGIALVASIIWGIIGIAALQSAQDSLNQKSTNSSSSQSTTKSDSKWDLEAAYDKVQTGMTKAQVEEVTSKKSTSCSSFEDPTIGKSETCSYGNSFTDGGSISVTYGNDGTVTTKYKYES